jgi:diphosphomevalonate decarboxylase
MNAVTAVAHPNIALSKYWGKAPGLQNVPAVPSLSVTLLGLQTRTTVEVGVARDRLVLNGTEVEGAATARVIALLDAVRVRAGSTLPASVTTQNDFPTASGLASSASGFAALALAASRAYGLDCDAGEVSNLARVASASAARSLFGGFVELVPGEAARVVAPPDHMDLELLVCVTTEAEKELSSRDGMNLTREASPYYGTWLTEAPRIHAELRAAVLAKDLPRVGELAEKIALAMHASAFAAGVIYFSGVTTLLYQHVRRLRARGVGAWATADAGPHLKVITSAKDAATLAADLLQVPGVLRVLRAKPGKGASII